MSLELKVLPPIVTVMVAGAMWGIASFTAPLEIPALLRFAVATVFALAGLAVSAAGIRSFRRARTTADPVRPETASVLVVSGIYRFTRNPMYLGIALLLIAWAVLLSSAWALLGPAVFVLYIGRFQIAPEERALSMLFGGEYAAYRARVRRWL